MRISPLQSVTVPPDADPDTRWWWDALAEDQLLIPQCRSCSRHFFPPIGGCPHCGSNDVAATPSDGVGTVCSWVVVHHALDEVFVGHTPYLVVGVELDVERVRMFGRAALGEIDSTTKVRVVTYVVDGTTLLGFERI